MTETPELSNYEKAFAKTDKTDAILVVDGKKLHVNKTFLSIHSDYFNTLFNSNFKEKSMEEIEIKDVEFEDFAAVLSLVHPHPIVPKYNAEKLLELADRFLLPAAKHYVELFIGTTQMDKREKLRIADKYDLDVLRDHAVLLYESKNDFVNIHEKTEHFSDRTQAKLYGRCFYLLSWGRFSL